MIIPNKIRIGGQDISVVNKERLDDNNLGTICLAEGILRIADNFSNIKQCESSKINTFIHEVVHGVLDTMGESELSKNEKFICTFSSLLVDPIEDIVKANKVVIDNDNEIIRSFIETNYDIIGSYTIKDNIVDVDGDVFVANKNIKSLTNGLFSFGVVDGYFTCDKCELLTTLKGAPKEISGSFDCRHCDSLITLEGAPKEVRGDFDCSFCSSLTSLKGAPKEVGKDFKCTYCDSLKSLEGSPEKVDRSFSCSNNNLLKTLKGSPKKVGGYFYCGYCNSLTSLEGAPKEVGGNFDCYRCNLLTTLKGAPAKIGGYFDCSFCNSLTTLEGAPKNVKIIK